MSTKSSILERDPVCGMNVNPATAKHFHEHGGQNYYFCHAACVEKFKADPTKYLNQSQDAPERPSGLVTLGPAATLTPPTYNHQPSAPNKPQLPPSTSVAYVCPMCPEVRESKPGACPSCGMALEPDVPAASTRIEYTCPMHPEIVRPVPGSCPICGMAREPRTVSAAGVENPELRDMTRRFWISLVLTAPLMAIAMAAMFWEMPLHRILPAAALPWLELALATPVALWAGWPFFQRF